jgi:hypothetical protein
LLRYNAPNIEGYNYPPADVVTAFESTRQHSESLEHIMKITLYNIQANFYQDASSMGEMSPFLLFDGDDDAKMDKRGMHSGKTDVAKKAGAGPVSWDDKVELHLKGNMIKVQGKASKPLIPDKVLGEGQVSVGGGGRQQCQLTDPKTGTVVGEVSFEVSQGGGMMGGTGGGMAAGGMTSGMGGNQGYNTTGGQGMSGQGYNQGGMGGQGMQSGQGYNNGGQMTTGGNQGYGNQQGTTGGMSGTGGGVGGAIGNAMGKAQEQFEKTTHSKHDHDESESHEHRTVR